jgi:parvulin-like peptidyl-prolyl isomerase
VASRHPLCYWCDFIGSFIRGESMRTALIGLLTFLTLTACEDGNLASGGSVTAAGPDATEAPGEVLATVNGLSVGSKEFETAAARKIPSQGDALSDDEKKEVLDRLVDEKLLYQAALAKGLDKDPKVQKVMINTLLREAVYANVRNSDFTDEDLQAYFEQHVDEFVVPEKVQIKRILIKVKDGRSDDEAKAEAKRIRREVIADPSKFKELAKKYSEDPYRRRGGDVGFVALKGKPGLDQAVVEKAFTLPKDGVSKVFKTDDGYNIVMVANKREKVERTFQQMKGSVLRKVKNEKLKSLYESYVGNLRVDAKIKTHDDRLSGIEVKAARRPAGPGMGPGMGGPPSKVHASK